MFIVLPNNRLGDISSGEEAVLFEIAEIIRNNKAEIAFPTQTDVKSFSGLERKIDSLLNFFGPDISTKNSRAFGSAEVFIPRDKILRAVDQLVI